MTSVAVRTVLMTLPIAVATWLVVTNPGVTVLQGEPAPPPVWEGQGPPPPPPTAEDGVRRDALLQRFGALLTTWREGRLEDAAELRAVADELARDHGRRDTREIVAFFDRMGPGERLQGWQDYQRALELSGRLYSAEVPAEPEAFEAFLRGIAAELEAFVAETGGRADDTAAAAALETLALVRLSLVDSLGEAAGPELVDGVREAATESLRRYAGAGQVRPRISPLYTLGDLERRLGNLRAAREHFEKVRTLAMRVGERDYREYALLELMRIGHDTGDTALVEFCLRDWARFRDPASCWPLTADYTQLLLQADRPEAALEFLRRHPPVAGDDGSVPLEDLNAHAVLEAAVLRRLGHVEEARSAFAAAESDALEGSLARLAEADLALAAGEGRRVIELLADHAEGFEIRERVQAFERLGQAWALEGRQDRARRWLRAALDLADEWQESTGDVLSGSVKGEWIGLHSVVQLAILETEMGDPLEAARLIEDHQSSRLRAALSGRAGISLEDLEAWATRYELGLLTWAIGPDRSVVAHVDPELGAWARTVPQGRRAVAAAVARLAQATLEGDEERAEALAREIGQVLLPPDCPLHARIGDPDDRLLVLVHGPVENLPLARLPVAGRPVDEALTLVVLPGLPSGTPAGEPVDLTRRPGSPPWTLLGAPLDAQGRHLLPGAASELQDLSRTHPRAIVHTGTEFDETAVRSALAAGGPLHVATHLVESRICASTRLAPVGLLLSRGRVFCAQEVLDAAPALPLVLLTTCDSGTGRFIDAEGLHGLGRAFLEGGTRNLLATLWPIGDEAAYHWSMHLHEGLLAGHSPSRAARRARLALRTAGFPAVDWAAFRFLGQD